jgi:hypothetical protein
MGGVLEELHARGLLHAVDQQARDGVHGAVARIDKHEAVCAERYEGIKQGNDAIVAALHALREEVKMRLDAGTRRFKRLEIAIGVIIAAIVLAAANGDSPFFGRVFDIGARFAAKFVGA